MKPISDSDFSTDLTVANPPLEVYEAIHRVREWWMTDITGDNRRIGDVFSFDVPSMHSCTMRVVQLSPGRRIVWRVVKSNMPSSPTPGSGSAATSRSS